MRLLAPHAVGSVMVEVEQHVSLLPATEKFVLIIQS